jgi:hypothetical protein
VTRWVAQRSHTIENTGPDDFVVISVELKD